MYYNTRRFWMSNDWTMPAGAGCFRTGRKRMEAGLPQAEFECSRPNFGMGGLAGTGLGLDPNWRDVKAPGCPANKRVLWFNQTAAGSKAVDLKRCIATSTVRDTGVIQRAYCCDKDWAPVTSLLDPGRVATMSTGMKTLVSEQPSEDVPPVEEEDVYEEDYEAIIEADTFWTPGRKKLAIYGTAAIVLLVGGVLLYRELKA